MSAEAPEGLGARRANTVAYLTDEQRRPSGWIGAQSDRVILARALRSSGAALGLVALLGLGIGCDKQDRDKAKQRATESGEKAKEGARDLKDRARDKVDDVDREQIAKEMREKAEKADKKIAALKEKMKSASEDAREKMKPALERAEKTRAKVGKELRRLGRLGKDKLDEGKTAVSSALEGLERDIEALQKELGGEAGGEAARAAGSAPEAMEPPR